MKLIKFFERTMRAACGPLRESDVVRAKMTAAREARAERPQNGPRNAQRAHPTGNTRKSRKAHRRERRP